MIRTVARGECERFLTNFTKTGSSFGLFYQLTRRPDTPLASYEHLKVLDSSFNPPHDGHVSLVQWAISGLGSATGTSGTSGDSNTPKVAVLLLLSVKNADKITPVPASFDHRMVMMALTAQHLFAQTHGVDILVGLTRHAKFVDKAEAIHEVMPSTQLEFLVGFDTLIRILDQKYYTEPLAQALDAFMTGATLLALTREDKSVPLTAQHSFVEQISSGQIPGIPAAWAERIRLGSGSQEALDISSSSIRAEVSRGTSDWVRHVPKTVAEYINANELYK